MFQRVFFLSEVKKDELLSAVRNTWQRDIGHHIAASTLFYSDLFILQHPAQFKLPHPPFFSQMFFEQNCSQLICNY